MVYFDAIRAKVRDEGLVKNKAVYLGIGVTCAGRKDVPGLWIEQTEGARFWFAVMNELKARDLMDVLIAVVDGLKGFPEAIERLARLGYALPAPGARRVPGHRALDRKSRSPTGYNFGGRLTESGSAKGGPHSQLLTLTPVIKPPAKRRLISDPIIAAAHTLLLTRRRFCSRSNVELEVVPPTISRQLRIAEQDLPHPIRVLHRDRLALSQLTRIVVHLRKRQYVSRHNA